MRKNISRSALYLVAEKGPRASGHRSSTKGLRDPQEASPQRQSLQNPESAGRRARKLARGAHTRKGHQHSAIATRRTKAAIPKTPERTPSNKADATPEHSKNQSGHEDTRPRAPWLPQIPDSTNPFLQKGSLTILHISQRFLTLWASEGTNKCCFQVLVAILY